MYKDEYKKEVKKSWCIRNVEQIDFPYRRFAGNKILTVACDSVTGEIIAHLVAWHEDGSVKRAEMAREVLNRDGYNPYEHNNAYDGKGAIIII